MRLRLLCAIAAMLPIASDSTAMAGSMIRQSGAIVPMPSCNRRKAIAKAASLGAELMNATTGVGAPSYTSGIHMWNGAAPNLKPMPITRNTRPKRSRLGWLVVDAALWMVLSDNEPVAPYSMDMPYSNRPEASALNTKYLIAASEDTRDSRLNAISA